ncbi:uncharacterized protein LOC135169781 [Diachasmimorpha longicaudata]|uniref:uncharacterized protein LOC135169781 n=1 Tax=Diachasmimorpha longicaudata TaxID=58733 RepID=UPI0030B8B440
MRAVVVFGIAFLATSWGMSVPENSQALNTISRGFSLFAKEFHTKTVKNVNGNLIMSPIGISMVTSMALFGADGNTKTQIKKALNLPEDDSVVKAGIKSMMDQHETVKSVQLKMANRIFTTTGFEIKPEFKEVTEKTFNSVVQNLDFKKPEAVETINAWAAEKTNNKIQNLIKSEDITDALMVLANAVYFKGNWAEPFNKMWTMQKTFHIDDKTTKYVPMMKKMDYLFYGELPTVKAKFVELPYAKTNDEDSYASMFLIVPNEINGLKDVEEGLKPLGLNAIRQKGSMQNVILEIPKFKMESTIDLQAVMQEMGMTDMFDDRANFTGITDSPPLKISKAMQKAMIEVNEEGTEAAAVSIMIPVPMSAQIPEPESVTLIVDRPFYFGIALLNNRSEDGQGKTILFSGRVVDPTQNYTRCVLLAPKGKYSGEYPGLSPGTIEIYQIIPPEVVKSHKKKSCVVCATIVMKLNVTEVNDNHDSHLMNFILYWYEKPCRQRRIIFLLTAYLGKKKFLRVWVGIPMSIHTINTQRLEHRILSYSTLIALGAVFMTSNFQDTASAAVDTKDANLRAVSTSLNLFAVDFFKAISKEKRSENLICSPVSVSMVLSMAAFGAGGATATEMRAGLRLPADDAVTKSGFETLIDTLNNVKKVKLQVANKIYTASGFEIKPAFQEVTKNSFKSAAESLDFGNTAAASATINSWCSAQTNGLIKEVVKPDDLDGAALVLVNAVYFKGQWKNKFKESLTRPKPFYIDSKTTKDVPMMNTRHSYNYGILPALDAQFVELPYEHDDEKDAISMFIILPNSAEGLAKAEDNLNTVNFQDLHNTGRTTDMYLYLPKFKTESSLNLQETLQDMGLRRMFSDAADFTKITNSPPLKISKVLQKAVIEVNEEGSEAAAVTVGIAVPYSLPAPPLQPITVDVNKPFVYAIVHGSTNTVLFQGHITLPNNLVSNCSMFVIKLKYNDIGKCTSFAFIVIAVVDSVNDESNEPITVEVNRPFVYAIVHQLTSTILFQGHITLPENSVIFAESALMQPMEPKSLIINRPFIYAIVHTDDINKTLTPLGIVAVTSALGPPIQPLTVEVNKPFIYAIVHVGIVGLAASIGEIPIIPITVEVNKPFIYAIVHRSTDTILFQGHGLSAVVKTRHRIFSHQYQVIDVLRNSENVKLSKSTCAFDTIANNRNKHCRDIDPLLTSSASPIRSFKSKLRRITRRALQMKTPDMSDENENIALRSIATSVNRFSTNFYKSLTEGESGNVVCSPVSVSMTLSMAVFGAHGNTQNELQSVLQLSADSSAVSKNIRLLLDRLTNFENVKLHLANKIFTASGFELKSEFKTITESSFRSDVQPVDFTKLDESSRIINMWCEKETEGRIKDVVQPNDVQDASLILVNAIHFKGKWNDPFQTEDTTPQSFSISDTVSKQVPMMYTNTNFNYGDIPDLDAQYIELPYESKDESDATSMYIILPAEVSGLKKVVENLEKVDFSQLNGPRHRVMLSLPKFKLESKLEVAEVLQKMGVKIAFTDAADFTGITDAPPLKVSKVIQKAFIEVNEEGTEAGAVSYMKLTPMCLPPSIVVDRPFLCALVAKNTGIPIFLATLDQTPIIAVLWRDKVSYLRNCTHALESQRSLSNCSSIVVVLLQLNSTGAFAMSTSDIPDALRTVTTGARKFSSEFYKVVADNDKKNLICSPLSVSMVLSMLTYGAREKTERELKTVLNFSDNETINKSGYQLLIDALNSIKSVQLKLANRIFVDNSLKINQEFQELTETYFRSASQNVDFKNTVEASNTINNWCQEKTNGRITNVVEPAGLNGVQLVLVNAVYFKGNWKMKFSPALTKPRPFHIDENTTKEVPMMQIEKRYRFCELSELNATCIELPYERNDETDALSMIIILPREITGLKAIEDQLNNINFLELLKDKLSLRNINLQLPKFKIESNLNLNPILQKMGMSNMFDASANFQGMTDTPISVSHVIQKAFIEVNEEGTEAAAVSAVMMVRCAMPVPAMPVIINRPFFCTIVATHTATPLFSARVVDPTVQI